MNPVRTFTRAAIPFVTWVLAVSSAFSALAPKDPIISQTPDGKLSYTADEHGNRVPDFSTCGYAGGDQPIPNAPIRIVVEPKPGDATARIQQAIDFVAALPADTNGLRGAVLLLKGRHEVFGGLWLTNSGVVLRGQGAGADGTVLVAAGQDRRTLIRIGGNSNRATWKYSGWLIADDYVSVGATSFRLAETRDLKVGATINIIRPSTAEWIQRLGATDFGGGEGGGWKPGSRDIAWERTIMGVTDNLITLDAPITTALEPGAFIGPISPIGRISQVGVENLRLESAFDPANPKDENHSWCGITMEDAADAWVRQVTFRHFAGSAVAIYESGQRITVEDCASLEPVSEDGGYRRNTFFTMGQQTLFLRCWSEQGRHDFAVGHCAAGPNAFVQCEAARALGDSGAIESWASGTLFDNVRIDGNGLSLGNRGNAAQGVGWAAANSVLWNCSASKIICANPPGAQNWSFGSWGEYDGDGVWRSSNEFVRPASLYAAQLAERLGPAAAGRVQLMPRPTAEATNPSIEEAAKLNAASRQPAPQLADFIAAASKRDPIPCEPGEAKRVEDIPATYHVSRITHHVLTITNGWLVCDGKLLVGGLADVAWWRGSIRPAEAPAFGPALTRFVPGRTGRGLTDDLDEVAGAMSALGEVALDQHYGLWYDRRRDDHERIRRMTGDVSPPFFEQPFARSGRGSAWDGLSQYDLTKFNSWYWSRLKQFADLCDQRGLVLFHENYFQHNIIEAGAHWVDCPWRTANNVNGTGFPEPPPFAGDKRIFMAEQFYDVTHPVRRALHRGFIRQCLDNFTNNANVIQFTSAEFSGPRHFVEFWLDTIGEWERDRCGRGVLPVQSRDRDATADRLEACPTLPIIALAAPKDVQDAILGDAQRSALVDVICFRYWWITDKGTYAPNGGLNLAPRQFQRQWRGGAPTDANLAAMAAEYRAKFPAKPVIAAGEQGGDLSRAGWAYVCAGGSLPNLPRTTDARLLAAIPRMRPWSEASAKDRWVLREAGKQFLAYAGADRELDLSRESGVFRLNAINMKTGEVVPGETVRAGGKLKLPEAAVVWLVKE